ncbi:MAG: fumarylacetoacetate hydrolase [Caldilineae bacterium]|nr:MAG: fumarylacetoacetate hydrolase [Caldilineae bacterium]
MKLTRHLTVNGPRWALNGAYLPQGMSLSMMLAMPHYSLIDMLGRVDPGPDAVDPLLPPVDPEQEIWGSGVTYLRSRDARKAESATGDIYEKVYLAERPEIFFKAAGWRAVGPGQAVRIREDATWNVPEPELTLVINAAGDIVGYTAGNDMSSRDIEGANPLYLPQAKTYNGSAAVGPAIRLARVNELSNLPIRMAILRGEETVFQGATATDRMKRGFPELAAYLYRELSFPHGALLMTGTGIVPPDDFTLAPGDLIRITVGELTLENRVER